MAEMGLGLVSYMCSCGLGLSKAGKSPSPLEAVQPLSPWRWSCATAARLPTVPHHAATMFDTSFEGAASIDHLVDLSDVSIRVKLFLGNPSLS